LKEQNDSPFTDKQFQELAAKLGERYDLKEIKFYDSVKDRSKDPIGYSRQQKFHSRLRKALPNLAIRTRMLRYVVSIDKKKVVDAARKVGIPIKLAGKLFLLLKKLGWCEFPGKRVWIY